MDVSYVELRPERYAGVDIFFIKYDSNGMIRATLHDYDGELAAEGWRKKEVFELAKQYIYSTIINSRLGRYGVGHIWVK